MYLYLVVAENGLFKIGKSENPQARAANIKTNSPCDVSTFLWIYYDDSEWNLEEDLHIAFAGQKIRGEWFALDYHDLNWILSTVQHELDEQISPQTQIYLRETLKEMREWGFFKLGRYHLTHSVQSAALNRLSVITDKYLAPDYLDLVAAE